MTGIPCAFSSALLLHSHGSPPALAQALLLCLLSLQKLASVTGFTLGNKYNRFPGPLVLRAQDVVTNWDAIPSHDPVAGETCVTDDSNKWKEREEDSLLPVTLLQSKRQKEPQVF